MPEQDDHSRTGVLVVIPARFESSRFRGKALADLEGQPLIVRVVANASGMKTADRIVVATDDERIRDAVLAAGFDCEMTGAHDTGTGRVGEVARRYRAEVIVNLQGDEPLLDPAAADKLVATMLDQPEVDIATCAHPFADEESWRDPNAVKVITDRRNSALYFSRAPIPGTFPGKGASPQEFALRHVGIYAFRRAALQDFLEFDRTPLADIEGLEQLRALENGMEIRVVTIAGAPVGVDTPADLEEVRRLWLRAQSPEE